MTSEPQRLQYLEAMGVTAWVARYRLPHARPTEVCEWLLPEGQEAAVPPSERLHALLDEAESTPRQPAAAAVKVPAPPRRARQLLGMAPEVSENDTQRTVEESEATPRPTQAPLRFTLRIACLAQRWLVVLPGEGDPPSLEARLLNNLFQAAGIGGDEPLTFESLRWPLIEGQPVAAPLEEAREGLRAFIDGTRLRGWAAERLLLFGTNDAVERLALSGSGADWVGIPVWQGPALGELAQSAEAKRGLWPTLLVWRQEWQRKLAVTGNADA